MLLYLAKAADSVLIRQVFEFISAAPNRAVPLY